MERWERRDRKRARKMAKHGLSFVRDAALAILKRKGK